MMRVRTAAKPSARAGSQGFVLLSLLFFVAAIAIQVVVSLPRAAMQAQRIREERLIYRGKQYKRAVQLYFRKYQKYPEKMDDLEETNGQRFLRRRYKDPLTGEDEWRLVHMGADGRMADSLIYDIEEEEGQEVASGYGGTGPNAPMGSSVGFPGYSAGFAASDGRFQGAKRARAVRQSAAPTIPGQSTPGAYGATEQAGYAGEVDLNNPNPSPFGVAPGQPGQPGQAGVRGQRGQPVEGRYPGYARVLPGQIPPAAAQRAGSRQGLPGLFGAQAGRGYPRGAGNRPPSNRTGFGSQGFGSSRGQPSPGRRTSPPRGFGVQGMNQQAANVIGRLLTQPRPGGFQGLAGRRQSASGQSSFSKGIAGVASKVEDRGVMVYEGRENYNEWEFVYDYRQEAGFGSPSVAQGSMAGQRPAGGQPGLTSGGFLTARPSAVGGVGGTLGSSTPSGSQRTGSPYGAGGASSPYGQRRPRRPGFAPNLPGVPTGGSPSPYSPGRDRRQPSRRPGAGMLGPGSPYPAPPPIPGITAPLQDNSGAAPGSPDARSRR